MDERTPFCPNCGAPQIRVTASDADQARPEMDKRTQPSASGYLYTTQLGTIQWRIFTRTALPLAALTGFIATTFFPAILVTLPLCFRRALSQYRPFHPGVLSSREGAKLGACMALLSFVFSLAFFLPLIVLGHDSLIGRIRDIASQYPDPQSQQMML